MSNSFQHEELASFVVDPAFLSEVRGQMLRFARQQLSDNDLAEDAVQEALVGALRNSRSFAGRAALKTWIFAILRNKIADILRQKMRSDRIDRALATEAEIEPGPDLFNAHGFWRQEERPVAWADPEAALRDEQFWKVFDACLNRLPPRQSRIFMMREFVELETQEICSELDITVTNLHVMLHRARLALRECLENNWFAGAPEPC